MSLHEGEASNKMTGSPVRGQGRPYTLAARLSSPENQLLTTYDRLSRVSLGFCHTVATEPKSVLAILMALKREPP